MFTEIILQEFLFICEYLKHFIRKWESKTFSEATFFLLLFLKATFGLEHLFQLLFFLVQCPKKEKVLIEMSLFEIHSSV